MTQEKKTTLLCVCRLHLLCDAEGSINGFELIKKLGQGSYTPNRSDSEKAVKAFSRSLARSLEGKPLHTLPSRWEAGGGSVRGH